MFKPGDVVLFTPDPTDAFPMEADDPHSNTKATVQRIHDIESPYPYKIMFSDGLKYLVTSKEIKHFVNLNFDEVYNGL